MEIATFAAGCFWGVEDSFTAIPGIISTRVGYCGGHLEHPSYQDVCSGTSGHAEALEITFDPQLISFESLLTIFWECHDPTQLNRQGPDMGSQYRSAIFYHSDIQKQNAEESLQQLEQSGRLHRPVATVIVPAGAFWEAEKYHQKYHQKHAAGCGF